LPSVAVEHRTGREAEIAGIVGHDALGPPAERCDRAVEEWRPRLDHFLFARADAAPADEVRVVGDEGEEARLIAISERFGEGDLRAAHFVGGVGEEGGGDEQQRESAFHAHDGRTDSRAAAIGHWSRFGYSSPVEARQRWLFALFAAAALLHLVPIWRVHYIPTVDGPSHVYNAVVLRELARGTPEFARAFAVNPRPNPNWLGHALMVPFAAKPLVAEKLLLSLIVLLFLWGCWRLGGVYAFLAMPLTFHLLLQMGFYNYSLGVALLLHAIASWWRRERGWITALWMLFCALAHPLPAAAAIAFVTIAWLMTDRRWARL